MNRLLLLFFAFATTACAAQARVAHTGGYSVQLVDEWGGSLPSYPHRGSTYVLGSYGTRYQVRVTNHTGQRIEAVVSVDGRDVVSGDAGDYRNQRGYLIDPWGSITVDGFRQNLSTVAAFRFTSPGDSYSARRGTPQNVGVIGVAVFREQHRPVARPLAVPNEPMWGFGHGTGGGGRGDDFDGNMEGEARAESSAAKSGAAQPASPAADEAAPMGRSRAPSRKTASRNNIGTQYGESHHSTVVEVPFVRRSSNAPDQVLALYYDDANGLQARGIQVFGRPYAQQGPQPFPAEGRFAPPPP
jgi:hypothetical protein